MRTIYINGRFFGAQLSGVPRYGRELLRSLDELLGALDAKPCVEVLLPKGISENFDYKELRVRTVGRCQGHAWEQFELPFYAWDGVLFTPTGSAPLIHPRNVVTIHDAIVFAAPAGFSAVYTFWYRLLSYVLCRTAARVLTVSNFSRSELVRCCKADPGRIKVIYPGAEHARSVKTDASIQERAGLKRFRYALAVGSRSPNKNFQGLIEAQSFLVNAGIEIALVGKTGLNVGRHVTGDEPLNTLLVKDLGQVTDGELRSLYENAGCFAFPSFYEGFGLPPLEALSLGCPVVISNAASLPEVCGEVALQCDPYSPKDIAEKIEQAMRLREDPSNAGRFVQFASQYTNERCTQAVWSILCEAASD